MNSEDLEPVHLETLISQTRLSVAVSDATGRMTLISPALQDLFGVQAGAVEEAHLVDRFRLFNHDGSAPLRTEDVPLARARRGEVVADAVITTRNDDGVLIYLRCSAAPLKTPDGEITGAIVLVQDVSAEQANRLEQDDLRERLVATINHEFRTPLTKLRGHAELLHDQRDELPEAARRSVDSIFAAARELADLLAVVTDLADLQAHTQLSKTYGNLADLLRDLATEMAPLMAARQLTLTSVLPEQAPATIDPERIRRALSELLANAAQYEPAGTEVQLRLRCEDHSIAVSVCDQGTGIAEEDRARLINPFECGAQPSQPVNSKGLGLTIANSCAIAHGGSLVLADNDPTGLCATLRLPRFGRKA